MVGSAIKRALTKKGYTNLLCPSRLELDLLNFNMRFSEISGGEKINEKQIFRIEKEFNTHMLENGFASLFDFIRLKEFLKSILLN